MGRTYRYKVIAVSEAGEGTPAEEDLVASIPPNAPTTPTLLEAKVELMEDTTREWYWVPLLSFEWSFEFHENKAVGGLPIINWNIYRSDDGVEWPAVGSYEKQNNAGALSVELPCPPYQALPSLADFSYQGELSWFRVTAVNSLGEGPPSESIRMRCSFPPGEQPAPARVGGDETSIIVEFEPSDLKHAELVAHRLTYGPLISDGSFDGPLTTVDLGLKHKRYNISGLMPGWTYAFKVQAISESGMSPDPGWQTEIVAGGLPSAPPAPKYVTSDGQFVEIEWQAIARSRNETGGSEILGFAVFVVADDRAWMGRNLSEAVFTMYLDQVGHNASSTYEHDCRKTPDYAMFDGSGQPMLVNASLSYLYAKVAIISQSGLGELSEAANLFCSPPPDEPALEMANVDANQVTLRWPHPELYGAPLIGYNIYIDDALGGELDLWMHLSADDLATDETNESVVLSLSPLQAEKHYRLRVTTATPAAESDSRIFEVETCRIPSTPKIIGLPTATAVWIEWDMDHGDTTFCNPIGYQVVAELVSPPDEYEGPNGSNMTLNESFEMWTNISEMLGTLNLGYDMGGLIPLATYRFKVRAHLASGTRDSPFSTGLAAGSPSQMKPPQHDLDYSSVSSIYLNWRQPNMNYGEAIGYQLFRDDGPGTEMRTVPEGSCIAAVEPSCTKQPCEFKSVQQVAHAAGCSVSGLKTDTFYRFRVRAINQYGYGPMSEAAEVPIGTVPAVTVPWLASAVFENCSTTWRWHPAVENGRIAHSYELKIQSLTPPTTTTTTMTITSTTATDVNATYDGEPTNYVVLGEAQAVYPEVVWALDGNSSKPFIAMEVTLNENSWSGFIPGGRYRAAVRARSDIGISDWSEWSSLEVPTAGYCLSKPSVVTGLRRDSAQLVRAGRVQLAWDPVTSLDQAGGDDPEMLGVIYELWGQPTPELGTTSWRSLLQIPTHQVDPLGVGPPVAVPAAAMIDTYPETAVTAFWVFKIRVKNRNEAYSDFGEEVLLSTGQLASVPRALSAYFATSGKIELSWQIPEANGYTPIIGYEARCGGSWEQVPNTRLFHGLQENPPSGLALCEVRAVNNVGPGPSATTSITVL